MQGSACWFLIKIALAASCTSCPRRAAGAPGAAFLTRAASPQVYARPGLPAVPAAHGEQGAPGPALRHQQDRAHGGPRPGRQHGLRGQHAAVRVRVGPPGGGPAVGARRPPGHRPVRRPGRPLARVRVPGACPASRSGGAPVRARECRLAAPLATGQRSGACPVAVCLCCLACFQRASLVCACMAEAPALRARAQAHGTPAVDAHRPLRAVFSHMQAHSWIWSRSSSHAGRSGVGA